MKIIIAFFLMTLTVGCAVKEPATPIRNVSMYDSPLIDHKVAMDNPYSLDYAVEKTEENKYNLVTTIQLFGGSFYVSPHSTRDFKGRFTIDIADNDHIIVGNNFVETPRSREEIDLHRFINGPVNWVNKDTRYDYPLTVLSQEDFDVHGKIIFTIEPKCTLEEIPFVIKFRSGVLSMEEWKC